jgi:hypothetical protein
MKVAVTGGRDVEPDIPWLWFELGRLGATGVAVGDCPTGVDWAVGRAIKAAFLPVLVFRADWKKHGRRAGPIRNREMLEAADWLIAFPGGRGTANCVAQAELILGADKITHYKGRA